MRVCRQCKLYWQWQAFKRSRVTLDSSVLADWSGVPASSNAYRDADGRTQQVGSEQIEAGLYKLPVAGQFDLTYPACT